MAEVNQNLNQNNQVAAGQTVAQPQPVMQGVQTPIFQAASSGGVVATLRPGQTSFEGQIRAESDRKTGQTDSNNQIMADLQGSQLEGVKLQKSASAGYLDTKDATQTEAAQPEAPKSVRNFKVGAERPERKPVNWVLILIIAGLAAILGFVIYFYLGQREAERPAPEPVVNESVVLNYWGLWEPSAVFTKVLNDFTEENPDISVIYEQKKDVDGYVQELQEALESGNGPDIFRYHASLRKLLEPQLSNMPTDVMSGGEFDTTFYPVASEQLKDEEGRIQGIPLMYDSLALIYNKQIFDEAGLAAPQTWVEFNQTAMALTLRSAEDGSVVRAGAAMGLADNVDFASDIVMLLAVQNGLSTDLAELDENILDIATTYYTNYYTDEMRRVWDESFDNSTTAFARGDVAMIIGPSWLIHDITKINPLLQIGVASVPQLDLTMPTEWATYYAEGVNGQAPEQRQLAAWKLLKYMSSQKVLEQLYLEQEETRTFGEIYPRRDMADRLANNDYVQPYLARAVTAVNMPFNDKTHDLAINQADQNLILSLVRAKTGEDNVSIPRDLVKTMWETMAQYGYVEIEE